MKKTGIIKKEGFDDCGGKGRCGGAFSSGNPNRRRLMIVERLDKVLSNAGAGSRKQIKMLAAEGRIWVNGVRMMDADLKIDVKTARVEIDGKEVRTEKHLYIMMNKPAGVVSASRDLKEKTVLDLLPESLRRPGLFPAGRLDKDTEGLLIITNDGEFAHRMLSPKKHVKKVYAVTCDVPVPLWAAEKFKEGIFLEDGMRCLPAEIRIVSSRTAMVFITEGKYHQVKRMMKAVGCRVVALKRLQIGKLMLNPGLNPGECQTITANDIKKIFESTE